MKLTARTSVKRSSRKEFWSSSLTPRFCLTLVFLSALLYLSTVFLHNWRFYKNFCADGFDFAVYLEVMRDIARGEWNPFNSIVQTPHLNDHWDPIFYAVSWISHLMPLQWAGWIIESTFLALCSLFSIWIFRNRPEFGPAGACAFIFFFLNRELFEAGFYPIHTSTFALLPIMAVGTWIATRDLNQRLTKAEFLFVLGVGALLSFFKQTLSVMPLGLALGFLFVPRLRRSGILLMPIFMFFAWFSMKGRALFIGPVARHLERVSFSFSQVLSLYTWDLAQLSSLLKFILEISPLLFLAFLSRKRFRKQDLLKFILILGFFFPYILGQILSGSFIRHYNSILIGAITTLAVAFVKPPERFMIRKTLVAVFAVASLFSISKFKKALFLTQNHNFVPACVRSDRAYDEIQERNERLADAVRRIKGSDVGHPPRVLSNGNLLPNLLTEIKDVDAFHIGTSPITNVPSVDWIFVEYGDYGYPPPAHPEGNWAERLKDIVLTNKGQIIEYAKGIFLARGPIPVEALKEFSSSDIGMKPLDR